MRKTLIYLFILAFILLIILIFILSSTPLISVYDRTKQKRAIWYNPFHTLIKIIDNQTELMNKTEAQIKLWDDFNLYHSLNISDIFFLTVSQFHISYNSVYQTNEYFDYDALALACQTAQHLNLNLHAWFVVGENYYLISQNASHAMIDINGNPNPEAPSIIF